MSLFDSIDAEKANFPALSFPVIEGLTVPANKFPDEESSTVVIPLRIKSYTLPSEKSMTSTVEVGSILNTTNAQATGGKTISFAQKELPKLSVEGEIDTPLVSDNDPLPNILLTVGAETFNITYGELINLYVSGDLNISVSNVMQRVQPNWFRDPYGRVYNSPRVLDYAGGFVEQVPGRTTFNLTLKV